MKNNPLFLVITALSLVACGSNVSIPLPEGVSVWGGRIKDGSKMPFAAGFEASLDDNRSNQVAPLLLTSDGRYVWSDTPFCFRITDNAIVITEGKVTVEKAGDSLSDAFKAASAAHFPANGEMPPAEFYRVPQYNTWIELMYNQNQEGVLNYARGILANGLPAGIIMIDDTWQEDYGKWNFHPGRFPDPKAMCDELHRLGFKVMLWICPFVSMDQYQICHKIESFGGFLNEADGHTPYPVRWWNGTSAMLDLTHPNAVAWFTEQLDRLCRDYGADGFKFDGGGIGFYAGTVAPEGSPRRTYAHDPNASPARQSALYGEFALKYRGSEYRNGFGFAGKPVIMRLHDKPHTWDALRRLIPDMLAAGLVGCPFICPDMIGGGEWTAFLPGAPFEPELFLRSAQVHALCPMMQISASPWRVLSPEHQLVFRDVVALRQRFAPRFVELAKHSARTGEPMMRNLEYAFPGRGYAEIKDEFLMGEDLLVAPVLEKGATSRRVVLPPGSWRADDGRTYDGPETIEADAPLARLPHFERIH